MCPTIALLGDIGTDHDGFHPSPVSAASPDVFLDGKPVARQGTGLPSRNTSGLAALTGEG